MTVSPSKRTRISIRQLGLFVLSMVVPSIVLVALGVRIIVQQEELTDKHVADQNRLNANELAQALIARLNRIMADPRDPAVALTAAIADGRLVLSWESESPGDLLGDGPFAVAIARAEREEFETAHLDAAASSLDKALTLTASDRQKAYAHLLRARVLAKARRPAEAAANYRILLNLPVSIVDQDGIPFAFYAGERLLAGEPTAADRATVNAVIDGAVGGTAALPPTAWYLLRSVDAAARKDKNSKTAARSTVIAKRIADGEHAVALQRDIPALIAQWKTTDDAWLPHGTPMWLVGSASSLAVRRTVVAVRADMLTLAQGSPALASGSAAGEWLGARFPGLKVTLPPVESNATERNLQRAFYAAALTIVLSVTLFGGYLLWRDVRREVRVAELRSQFVSSVSHELKTPLTAIRMFAETLQLNRVDQRTRTEYLDTIVNESERLTRLLNNVLDFSKIEEGRKTYRREVRSLVDIVQVAARAMAYPLEQHGFALRVEVDDSVPPVDVDADALEQAILNLLTNAMKYSDAGSAITLRLVRDGRQAVVSVEDEGIGIAPADRARIFEKFYRVATPHNQRIPGTGLGLTLVDHIVKAHEGSVRVESAPGRGSVFSIHLPLGADPAELATVEATS